MGEERENAQNDFRRLEKAWRFIGKLRKEENYKINLNLIKMEERVKYCSQL